MIDGHVIRLRHVHELSLFPLALILGLGPLFIDHVVVRLVDLVEIFTLVARRVYQYWGCTGYQIVIAGFKSLAYLLPIF